MIGFVSVFLFASPPEKGGSQSQPPPRMCDGTLLHPSCLLDFLRVPTFSFYFLLSPCSFRQSAAVLEGFEASVNRLPKIGGQARAVEGQ